VARFYADENIPFPVVVELRSLGHDVTTAAEAGNAGQAIPDEAVLGFATTEQRILLTLNRKHFIRLHAVAPNHAGILVCTFDPNFAAQAHRIHEAVRAVADPSGQLIRVNRPPA
jgi:hypothetical protein